MAYRFVVWCPPSSGIPFCEWLGEDVLRCERGKQWGEGLKENPGATPVLLLRSAPGYVADFAPSHAEMRAWKELARAYHDPGVPGVRVFEEAWGRNRAVRAKLALQLGVEDGPAHWGEKGWKGLLGDENALAKLDPEVMRLDARLGPAPKPLRNELGRRLDTASTPPPPSPAHPTTIKSLAVVTCFYNPCRYEKPLANYRRFAAGITQEGLELYTVELVFDDDNPQIPGAHVVRGTRAYHLMWQKERLLNIAVGLVPEKHDAIAWVDADVLFMRRGWGEATKKALGSLEVVQPYSGVMQLASDGNLSGRRRPVGWYFQNEREKSCRLGVAHPGYAWAARAGWLRKHGLLENNVIGGGDSMMLPAFVGDVRLWLHEKMSPGWLAACDEWCEKVRGEVGGAFGYVDGDILHQQHGSLGDRLYNERLTWLTDHDYEPTSDIGVCPETGLLRWTEQAITSKSEMVRLVGNYFEVRKEDGEGGQKKTAPLWILGTPRSGTTLLANYLNDALGVSIQEKYNRSPGHSPAPPHTIPAFNKVFPHQYKPFWGDMKLERVERARPGVRWVYVFRRDKEAQSRSFAVARKTGVWQVKPGEVSPQAEPEPAELERARRDVETMDVECREALQNRPHYTICYEELVENPRQVLRGLLEWLGRPDVDVETLKPRTGKQSAELQKVS